MRAQQPNASKTRPLLIAGACIALTGCALTNSEQPNVSAQPPANLQSGAVLFLNEARQLEEQKKFEEAARLYTRIMAESPAAEEAYPRLTRIQLGLEQFEAAQKTIDRYRGQFPKRAAPLLLQAAALNRQNRLEEGEKAYRSVSEQFPDNEEALLGLSLTLLKLNRIDETAELLDEKLAASADWGASPYALRAQVALMRHASDEAAQVESVRRSIFFLNTATAKEPDRAELWLRKSELERAVRDYPAATDSLEALQKLTPDNTRVSEALIPLYLQQEAYTKVLSQIKRLVTQQNEKVIELTDIAVRHALVKGNPQAALTLAKTSAQLLPGDIDAQFLYGFTLIQSKQFSEAEQLLQQTRKKLYADQPNSFDPRLELYYGIALLQQLKTGPAAEVFTELAAQQFDAQIAEYLQLLINWQDREMLTPLAEILREAGQQISNSAYLPYFRALIHHQQKEYAAALRAFASAEKKAAYLGEKKQDFLDDNFYFQFAGAYERCKQYDEAEALFRKAIGMNPQRADAMNYLAYMWAENNTHLDEACELITRAIEMHPGIGAFIDTLGWIYYHQGRYPEAMEQLTKAAELEPKDPTVHEHLGDCALKLNRPQDARKHYLKSIEVEANEKIQSKIDAIPAE